MSLESGVTISIVRTWIHPARFCGSLHHMFVVPCCVHVYFCFKQQWKQHLHHLPECLRETETPCRDHSKSVRSEQCACVCAFYVCVYLSFPKNNCTRLLQKNKFVSHLGRDDRSHLHSVCRAELPAILYLFSPVVGQ